MTDDVFHKTILPHDQIYKLKLINLSQICHKIFQLITSKIYFWLFNGTSILGRKIEVQDQYKRLKRLMTVASSFVHFRTFHTDILLYLLGLDEGPGPLKEPVRLVCDARLLSEPL